MLGTRHASGLPNQQRLIFLEPAARELARKKLRRSFPETNIATSMETPKDPPRSQDASFRDQQRLVC